MRPIYPVVVLSLVLSPGHPHALTGQIPDTLAKPTTVISPPRLGGYLGESTRCLCDLD